MKSHKPSQLFKRITLALLIPLLLLGGAELLLRMMNYGYPTSFLIPVEMDGQRLYADNQFFGYRFFPQRMTRTPAPIILSKTKREGTVRIFVLGGSAAMGEPLSEFGFARHLQGLLSARCSETRFEVINAAMTAINSHVALDIAQCISAFDPDVFVIYMGNNEVVGPFGPGSVLREFNASRAAIRLRLWVSRLRLAQMVKHVLRPWMEPESGNQEWQGMEMFSQREVKPGDRRMDAVYQHFYANLEALIRIAQKAGADVVLSTVAVNLQNCPPFAGEDAMASYTFATNALARGEPDEALEAFEQACDFDHLRFRADRVINGGIRQIAERKGDAVSFVDARELVAEASSDGVPGAAHFIDHVHFTFEGNHLVAAAMADAIVELPRVAAHGCDGPTLSATEAGRRLLYTPWDELEFIDVAIERRRRAPFVGQPGNAAFVADLIRKKLRLADVARQTDLKTLKKRFTDAEEDAPESWFYPLSWGELMSASGRYNEAVPALETALAMLPHRYDVRAALALALGASGKGEEAAQLIRGDDEKYGHFPVAYLLRLSEMLTEEGHVRSSLSFVEEALAIDRLDAAVWSQLAECYGRLNRMEDAERALRSAIELAPDNIAYQEDLGLMLTVTRRWNEADALFEKIADRSRIRPEGRLKYALSLMYRGDVNGAERELLSLVEDYPDYAEGHFNLGLLHLKAGDAEAALPEFSAVIELEPDSADAHYHLAQALRARGDSEAALSHLAIARQLAPHRQDIAAARLSF